MKVTDDIAYSVINTPEQLENLVNTIEKEKAIGVDLEADSMYHFKEKVCLVQIATSNRNFVIDPLVLNDLSPLKPIFLQNDICKIFHGADYDVRSLFRDFRISINSLFDTELACRFLGSPESGLEAVLKKRFQITLNKKYQRKDWSKRPLPQEMIAYAAKDAGYLLPLAQSLQAELEKKGRLDWVHEECEYLSKVRPNTVKMNPLFTNFKGAGKLNPRSLAVLEALLQFRLKTAQKKDKPLFRILSSRSLLSLATKKPVNLTQLEKTAALSPKQISMYGRRVTAAIERASKIPPKELPVYPRKKSPKVPLSIARRVKALKIWRESQVQKLAIDPALICTKSLISTIAVQRPKTLAELYAIKEMKNWQKKEFGQGILEALNQVH